MNITITVTIAVIRAPVLVRTIGALPRESLLACDVHEYIVLIAVAEIYKMSREDLRFVTSALRTEGVIHCSSTSVTDRHLDQPNRTKQHTRDAPLPW